MLILLFFFLFLLLYFAGSVCFGGFIDLRRIFEAPSSWLHQVCVDATGGFHNSQEAVSALLCGRNIESFELFQLYSSTGLIHLLVVSGSHLILLKNSFEWIFNNVLNYKSQSAKMIIFLFLFVFVLTSKMNPPVFRSFLSLAIFEFIESKKWHWHFVISQFMTSYICYFINPHWVTSLSFQMSWIAASAIELSSVLAPDHSIKKSLLKTGLIFSSFSFVFLLFGPPHLSAPVISLIFSPVLEFVLFPLAIFGVFFQGAADLFNTLFEYLNFVLDLFSYEKLPPMILDSAIIYQFNSLVIAILSTAIIVFRKKKT